MGLSATGLVIPSAGEILAQMVADYEALTGLTLDTTDTSDQFVMIAFTIVADRIYEATQLGQAIYDGTKPDTAEGIQAEDAAYLVGVEPDPATYSSATVALTGTAGTVVPIGSVVEGGGPADDARWNVSKDTVIPGSVVVTAQESGPIEAVIAAINTIVTAVPGWTAVSNAAAATPGQARESAAELRRKRRRALATGGAASRASILSVLLELDYIEEAIVIENASNLAGVISGKAMDPNSLWIFLTPSTLTAAQVTAVAAEIHRKVAAGTEMMGAAGPTLVTRTVTDAGGSTGRVVQWNYGADAPTSITATVTLEPGYTLSDVTSAIRDAVTAFFAGLGMGDVLQSYDLVISTAGIEGIAALSFVAGIGGLPYTPAIDAILTLTTVIVV